MTYIFYMAKKEQATEQPMKSIEEWRQIKLPVKYSGKINSLTREKAIDIYSDKSWLYESAKILNQWLSGEVLTEEQFDAGLKKAEGYSAK